ncbi:MAG: hypothetical protein RMK20_00190 [Verrucomicrobiales bacterium]|nr:hypothetical protein [Verrucomicrobiales bacterium]
MNPKFNPGRWWITGASSLLLSAAVCLGASRESQRVAPVFERPIIEPPVFARPGKPKPRRPETVRPEVPSREPLVAVRPRLEKPSREPALFDAADVRDVFRRPRPAPVVEGFPHRRPLDIPRRFVPGHGNNYQSYIRGPRYRVREHTRLQDVYYFRDRLRPKPDKER